MTINDLMRRIHGDNIDRGWWDGVPLPLDTIDERDTLIATSKLMLVVSELSEALEEVRNGRPLTEVYREGVTAGPTKPLGFPTELADALIRILDLAYACGIYDFEKVIEEKLAYNRARGHKHGGKKL